METSRAVLIRDGNRPKHVGCLGVRRVYIKGLKPRSEELIAFTLSTPGNYHRHAQTYTQRQERRKMKMRGPSDQGMDFMRPLWFHFELKILEPLTMASRA